MARVLIYRTELLTYSETFIRRPAEALSRYVPTFVGLGPARRNQGLRGADVVMLTSGRTTWDLIRKTAYKYVPVAPLFHRRIMARQDAVLLHAHLAEDGVLALPIAHLTGLPLVVSLHGSVELLPDERLKLFRTGRLYLRGRAAMWDRTSVFLCASEFVRKKALAAGFPESKLLVHSIGVDVEKFAGEGAREPGLVLFAGRLHERKGVRYLIEAMQGVGRDRPHARLVVIGDGEERQALEQLARERDVPVEFLGAIDNDLLPKWMQRARVFCGPSVGIANGDAEALGMVYLEAQAAGLPVVAFRHGGVPEAVLGGVTGTLVNEGDVAALASALVRLLGDDGYWDTCATAARTHVLEHFDLRKQAEKLERIYDTACAAR